MKLNSLSDKIDPIHGEVAVKPFDRNGFPLKDPFSIFQYPSEAKSQVEEVNGYLELKGNLVVNLGRQTIAYLIGGRDYSSVTPNNNWIVTKVSWGVGEEAPRFTDTSLSPQAVTGETSGGENEIIYDTDNGYKKKSIASTDWPSPFLVRFEAVLGADEAVGYLIREMGLWTSNNTLFARKVFPAINKSGDFGLSFLWRIRS